MSFGVHAETTNPHTLTPLSQAGREVFSKLRMILDAFDPKSPEMSSVGDDSTTSLKMMRCWWSFYTRKTLELH